jgi:hypothetical protein
MEIGCVICFFKIVTCKLIYILAVKKAIFFNQVLLAQSVEREACNHGVGSSKLTRAQSTFDFFIIINHVSCLYKQLSDLHFFSDHHSPMD